MSTACSSKRRPVRVAAPWADRVCPQHPQAAQAQVDWHRQIHGELWGVPKDSQDSRTPQSIAAVSARLTGVSGSGLMFCAYRLIGSLTNESQAMEDLRTVLMSQTQSSAQSPPRFASCTNSGAKATSASGSRSTTSCSRAGRLTVLLPRCSTRNCNVSWRRFRVSELGHRIEEQWHRLN